MVKHMFPQIPDSYPKTLKPLKKCQVVMNRCVEAQKLGYRNCHSERHDYLTMTLPAFRSMMTARDEHDLLCDP